jgi:hypothetical protein
MSYSYPFVQQPYQYQDQLNQLRNAPMSMVYQPARADGSGLNWVQGEAGAKSWIVAPGSTVLLMDSESQRFYLKAADQSGMPSLRVFEYTELGAEKPQTAPQQTNFVTAQEFMDFKKSIEDKLQELSEPVEVSLTRKKKGDNNE